MTGDNLLEEVDSTREGLREEARARLGVAAGSTGDLPPLREVLRQRNVSAYPLFALGVLSIVDSFQGFAFRVLVPEVSATLGIGRGAVSGILAVSGVAVFGTLGVAALAQKARRAALIITTGFLWSLVAIASGFVTSALGLALVLILDVLTTSTVGVLHVPVLMDSYPPEGRVRAVSYWFASNSAGNVLAPLLVALFATTLGLTWRGVLVAMGLMSFMAVFSSLRLRDPGFGKWDSEQIRAAVREKETQKPSYVEAGLSESDVSLRFFEIWNRLLIIPTVKRLLGVQVAFGFFVVPYSTFQSFFLDERWNLGPGPRGLFVAYLAGVAVVSLSVFGRRGEAMYRESPSRLVSLSAALIGGAVVAISLAALSPWFGLMAALFGVSAALFAALAPSLNIAALSVIPSGMRSHAVVMIGVATLFGSILGSIMLGGVANQYGITGAMVALMIPGLFAALLLRNAASEVSRDLDRMIDETLEDEEIKLITGKGGHLPMLACRSVSFSYDQVQVLFDVDFTVDEGEIVALLGTNGAGKSTLLKVLSGIGLPSAGAVRYRGANITYLDAERRLRLGITQVPGGRAVFAPMSVVENLRVFGYSLGRDSKRVNEAIARSLEAFPSLGDRRNQKASTLSGGEQQMLGLAKAVMLEPKLLLVDELSLGLAPIVVGQLLDMIRRINERGTAVVLVEQSVNIALNLVDHAYFMEKGEIRFDGRSSDLLARDDLLRAVFLEGAGERSRTK